LEKHLEKYLERHPERHLKGEKVKRLGYRGSNIGMPLEQFAAIT
jgi:hypothetical protein